MLPLCGAASPYPCSLSRVVTVLSPPAKVFPTAQNVAFVYIGGSVEHLVRVGSSLSRESMDTVMFHRELGHLEHGLPISAGCIDKSILVSDPRQLTGRNALRN